MLFISAGDFFEKAKQLAPLTREEEIALARRMQQGDTHAREKLVQGYWPFVSAVVRRQPDPGLELVLRCCVALEKAVDSFDFLQESERFSHRLSWVLRQTCVRYQTDRAGGDRD